MRTRTLRSKVLRSLKEQGFRLQGSRLLLPSDLSKEGLRQLHQTAVAHKLERSKHGLVRYQEELLQSIASGADVVPEKIHPVLVEVQPNSKEELLFRYATLHWSIPVSSGYGRRLRFLVIDNHNRKLIGVIGLGDPIFSLGTRDSWIVWTKEDRQERLHLVMDAFVLGAVPPYSFLLCGKLVAMLVASNQVREAFHSKYAGSFSLIRKRTLPSQLVSLTTVSALGRILSVVSGRGCNSVVHGGRGFLDIGVCDRQSKTSDASLKFRGILRRAWAGRPDFFPQRRFHTGVGGVPLYQRALRGPT